ncbi:MAG: hypothetical protein ACRD63_00735, partial [Pyrinomonadaceae bacterium]
TTVTASIEELNAGYLRWMDLHPNHFQVGKPLMLSMPRIDLYSPSGTLLYSGEDSEQNAKFINNSLAKFLTIKHEPTTIFRPTLKEALNLLPKLTAQRTENLPPDTYILFAVTYPDTSMCKAQNDVISQLVRRVLPFKLRIIQLALSQ